MVTEPGSEISGKNIERVREHEVREAGASRGRPHVHPQSPFSAGNAMSEATPQSLSASRSVSSLTVLQVITRLFNALDDYEVLRKSEVQPLRSFLCQYFCFVSSFFFSR